MLRISSTNLASGNFLCTFCKRWRREGRKFQVMAFGPDFERRYITSCQNTVKWSMTRFPYLTNARRIASSEYPNQAGELWAKRKSSRESVSRVTSATGSAVEGRSKAVPALLKRNASEQCEPDRSDRRQIHSGKFVAKRGTIKRAAVTDMTVTRRSQKSVQQESAEKLKALERIGRTIKLKSNYKIVNCEDPWDKPRDGSHLMKLIRKTRSRGEVAAVDTVRTDEADKDFVQFQEMLEVPGSTEMEQFLHVQELRRRSKGLTGKRKAVSVFKVSDPYVKQRLQKNRINVEIYNQRHLLNESDPQCEFAEVQCGRKKMYIAFLDDALPGRADVPALAEEAKAGSSVTTMKTLPEKLMGMTPGKLTKMTPEKIVRMIEDRPLKSGKFVKMIHDKPSGGGGGEDGPRKGQDRRLRLKLPSKDKDVRVIVNLKKGKNELSSPPTIHIKEKTKDGLMGKTMQLQIQRMEKYWFPTNNGKIKIQYLTGVLTNLRDKLKERMDVPKLLKYPAALPEDEKILYFAEPNKPSGEVPAEPPKETIVKKLKLLSPKAQDKESKEMKKEVDRKYLFKVLKRKPRKVANEKKKKDKTEETNLEERPLPGIQELFDGMIEPKLEPEKKAQQEAPPERQTKEPEVAVPVLKQGRKFVAEEIALPRTMPNPNAPEFEDDTKLLPTSKTKAGQPVWKEIDKINREKMAEMSKKPAPPLLDPYFTRVHKQKLKQVARQQQEMGAQELRNARPAQWSPSAQSTQQAQWTPSAQSTQQQAQWSPSAQSTQQQAQWSPSAQSTQQQAQWSPSAQSTQQQAQWSPSAQGTSQAQWSPSAHSTQQHAQWSPSAQSTQQHVQWSPSAQSTQQQAQWSPTAQSTQQQAQWSPEHEQQPSQWVTPQPASFPSSQNVQEHQRSALSQPAEQSLEWNERDQVTQSSPHQQSQPAQVPRSLEANQRVQEPTPEQWSQPHQGVRPTDLSPPYEQRAAPQYQEAAPVSGNQPEQQSAHAHGAEPNQEIQPYQTAPQGQRSETHEQAPPAQLHQPQQSQQATQSAQEAQPVGETQKPKANDFYYPELRQQRQPKKPPPSSKVAAFTSVFWERASAAIPLHADHSHAVMNGYAQSEDELDLAVGGTVRQEVTLNNDAVLREEFPTGHRLAETIMSQWKENSWGERSWDEATNDWDLKVAKVPNLRKMIRANSGHSDASHSFIIDTDTLGECYRTCKSLPEFTPRTAVEYNFMYDQEPELRTFENVVAQNFTRVDDAHGGDGGETPGTMMSTMTQVDAETTTDGFSNRFLPYEEIPQRYQTPESGGLGSPMMKSKENNDRMMREADAHQSVPEMNYAAEPETRTGPGVIAHTTTQVLEPLKSVPRTLRSEDATLSRVGIKAGEYVTASDVTWNPAQANRTRPSSPKPTSERQTGNSRSRSSVQSLVPSRVPNSSTTVTSGFLPEDIYRVFAFLSRKLESAGGRRGEPDVKMNVSDKSMEGESALSIKADNSKSKKKEDAKMSEKSKDSLVMTASKGVEDESKARSADSKAKKEALKEPEKARKEADSKVSDELMQKLKEELSSKLKDEWKVKLFDELTDQIKPVIELKLMSERQKNQLFLEKSKNEEMRKPAERSAEPKEEQQVRMKDELKDELKELKEELKKIKLKEELKQELKSELKEVLAPKKEVSDTKTVQTQRSLQRAVSQPLKVDTKHRESKASLAVAKKKATDKKDEKKEQKTPEPGLLLEGYGVQLAGYGGGSQGGHVLAGNFMSSHNAYRPAVEMRTSGGRSAESAEQTPQKDDTENPLRHLPRRDHPYLPTHRPEPKPQREETQPYQPPAPTNPTRKDHPYLPRWDQPTPRVAPTPETSPVPHTQPETAPQYSPQPETPYYPKTPQQPYQPQYQPYVTPPQPSHPYRFPTEPAPQQPFTPNRPYQPQPYPSRGPHINPPQPSQPQQPHPQHPYYRQGQQSQWPENPNKPHQQALEIDNQQELTQAVAEMASTTTSVEPPTACPQTTEDAHQGQYYSMQPEQEVVELQETPVELSGVFQEPLKEDARNDDVLMKIPPPDELLAQTRPKYFRLSTSDIRMDDDKSERIKTKLQEEIEAVTKKSGETGEKKPSEKTEPARNKFFRNFASRSPADKVTQKPEGENGDEGKSEGQTRKPFIPDTKLQAKFVKYKEEHEKAKGSTPTEMSKAKETAPSEAEAKKKSGESKPAEKSASKKEEGKEKGAEDGKEKIEAALRDEVKKQKEAVEGTERQPRKDVEEAIKKLQEAAAKREQDEKMAAEARRKEELDRIPPGIMGYGSTHVVLQRPAPAIPVPQDKKPDESKDKKPADEKKIRFPPSERGTLEKKSKEQDAAKASSEAPKTETAKVASSADKLKSFMDDKLGSAGEKKTAGALQDKKAESKKDKFGPVKELEKRILSGVEKLRLDPTGDKTKAKKSAKSDSNLEKDPRPGSKDKPTTEAKPSGEKSTASDLGKRKSNLADWEKDVGEKAASVLRILEKGKEAPKKSAVDIQKVINPDSGTSKPEEKKKADQAGKTEGPSQGGGAKTADAPKTPPKDKPDGPAKMSKTEDESVPQSGGPQHYSGVYLPPEGGDGESGSSGPFMSANALHANLDPYAGVDVYDHFSAGLAGDPFNLYLNKEESDEMLKLNAKPPRAEPEVSYVPHDQTCVSPTLEEMNLALDEPLAMRPAVAKSDANLRVLKIVIEDHKEEEKLRAKEHELRSFIDLLKSVLTKAEREGKVATPRPAKKTEEEERLMLRDRESDLSLYMQLLKMAINTGRNEMKQTKIEEKPEEQKGEKDSELQSFIELLKRAIANVDSPAASEGAVTQQQASPSPGKKNELGSFLNLFDRAISAAESEIKKVQKVEEGNTEKRTGTDMQMFLQILKETIAKAERQGWAEPAREVGPSQKATEENKSETLSPRPAHETGEEPARTASEETFTGAGNVGNPKGQPSRELTDTGKALSKEGGVATASKMATEKAGRVQRRTERSRRRESDQDDESQYGRGRKVRAKKGGKSPLPGDVDGYMDNRSRRRMLEIEKRPVTSDSSPVETAKRGRSPRQARSKAEPEEEESEETETTIKADKTAAAQAEVEPKQQKMRRGGKTEELSEGAEAGSTPCTESQEGKSRDSDGEEEVEKVEKPGKKKASGKSSQSVTKKKAAERRREAEGEKTAVVGEQPPTMLETSTGRGDGGVAMTSTAYAEDSPPLQLEMQLMRQELAPVKEATPKPDWSSFMGSPQTPVKEFAVREEPFDIEPVAQQPDPMLKRERGSTGAKPEQDAVPVEGNIRAARAAKDVKTEKFVRTILPDAPNADYSKPTSKIQMVTEVEDQPINLYQTGGPIPKSESLIPRSKSETKTKEVRKAVTEMSSGSEPIRFVAAKRDPKAKMGKRSAGDVTQKRDLQTLATGGPGSRVLERRVTELDVRSGAKFSVLSDDLRHRIASAPYRKTNVPQTEKEMTAIREKTDLKIVRVMNEVPEIGGRATAPPLDSHRHFMQEVAKKANEVPCAQAVDPENPPAANGPPKVKGKPLWPKTEQVKK